MQEDFAYAIDQAVLKLGINSLTLETEYAPGQFEFTFQPKFGIESTDESFIFREAVSVNVLPSNTHWNWHMAGADPGFMPGESRPEIQVPMGPLFSVYAAMDCLLKRPVFPFRLFPKSLVVWLCISGEGNSTAVWLWLPFHVKTNSWCKFGPRIHRCFFSFLCSTKIWRPRKCFSTHEFYMHLQVGNGSHLNFSLWNKKRERNVFYDADDPNNISDVCRYFLGTLHRTIRRSRLCNVNGTSASLFAFMHATFTMHKRKLLPSDCARLP